MYCKTCRIYVNTSPCPQCYGEDFVSDDKILIFVSRHAPNNGQIALAQSLGYEWIRQVNIVFSQDPIKDLLDAGINEKTLAIVAPSYITNKLLNEGYTLYEFVNSQSKRVKNVFCCEGAYKYYKREYTNILDIASKDICRVYPDAGGYFSEFPKRIFGEIGQDFFPCPISIEKQEESSLIPELKK